MRTKDSTCLTASRSDVFAVERANNSRKFSLRFGNRRHESVASLFRLR